jgi:hypothetical protein
VLVTERIKRTGNYLQQAGSYMILQRILVLRATLTQAAIIPLYGFHQTVFRMQWTNTSYVREEVHFEHNLK